MLRVSQPGNQRPDRPPLTPFVERALEFLTEVKSIGRTKANPVEVIGGNGHHRWKSKHPRCVVLHLAIHTPTLIDRSVRLDHIAADRCVVCGGVDLGLRSVEPDWPMSSRDLAVAENFHVEVVLLNEPEARPEDRVRVHATVPVFHPNVGVPYNKFCLYAKEDPSLTLADYLDQTINMAGWYVDAVNPRDQHNDHAIEHYQACQATTRSFLKRGFTQMYRANWRMG